VPGRERVRLRAHGGEQPCGAHERKWAIVGLYCTGRSPLRRCPPLPSSGAPGKEQGYEALLLGLPGVTRRRLWRLEHRWQGPEDVPTVVDSRLRPRSCEVTRAALG
jgi:hypothetical protein